MSYVYSYYIQEQKENTAPLFSINRYDVHVSPHLLGSWVVEARQKTVNLF